MKLGRTSRTHRAAASGRRTSTTKRSQRLAVVVVAVLSTAGSGAVAGPQASAATGATFAGVLQLDDGRPVANASIVLTDATGEFARTTDDAGRFSFGVLSAVYAVKAAGAVPDGIAFSLSANVDLASDLVGATIAVPLRDLPVSVVDAAGAPIEGASVSVRTSTCTGIAVPGLTAVSIEASPTTAPAPTNAAGLAFVPAVACQPGGGTASIDVSAAGFLSKQLVVEDLTGVPFVAALVRSHVPATLSGVVTDVDGNPLANVPITVTGGGMTDPALISSEADGSYSVDLETGRYSLRFANPPNSVVTYTRTQIVELTGSIAQTLVAPVVPATFVVTWSGGPLVGAIVSPRDFRCGQGTLSTPSLGIGIDLLAAQPTTDADGRVSFEVPDCVPRFGGPIGGPYRFTVTPQGALSGTVLSIGAMHSAGVIPVQLVQLAGIVTDQGGVPVSGTGVDISTPAAGTVRQLTLADGSFRYYGARAPYTLSATATTGTSQYVVTARVADGDALDIPLSMPLGSLSVHVRDATGGPIGGARVSSPSAECSFSEARPGVNVARSLLFPSEANVSMADSAGTATVQSVPCEPGVGARQVVNVSAAGYLSETQTVGDLSGSAFAVTLQTLGVSFPVAGQVVDAAGRPVPDAVVQLVGTSPVPQVTTQADGRFSLTVPVGEYSATVSSSAQSSLSYKVFAGPVSVRAPVLLSIPLPLVSVDFVVSNPQGEAVSGVEVAVATLECSYGNSLIDGFGPNPTGNQAHTDAAGRVSVSVPRCAIPLKTPVLNYGFRVMPPSGYAPRLVSVSALGGSTPTAVVLNPTTTFSGVLTDASGVGLGGVAIGITSMTTSSRLMTTSGVDGSFRFEVDSGSYFLDASATVDGISYNITGTVNPSSSGPVTIRLRPLAPMPVIVRNLSGHPIPQAIVEANTASCGLESSDPAVSLGVIVAIVPQPNPSDESGTTSIQTLRCPAGLGRASVTVNAAGYLARVGQSTADLSGSPLVVELLGTTERTTYTGTVLDSGSHPVSGVAVSEVGGPVQGESAVTGADGSFAIRLTPGHHVLTISADGLSPSPLPASWAVDIGYPDQSLLFYRLPLVRITIQLTGTGGVAVPGTSVTPTLVRCILPNGRSQTTPPGPTQISNADGVVAFWLPWCPNLPSISARAFDTFHIVPPPEYAERFFVLDDVSRSSTIAFSLASLSGQMNAGGSKLSGQVVTLLGAEGTTISADASTATGGFAVSGPAGVYSVGLSGAFGDPTTYQVTVPNVDLTVPIRADLILPVANSTLQVRSLDGEPIAGAQIVMACTATSFPLLSGIATGTECATEATDAFGLATLSFLPTGPVTLTVTPPPGVDLMTETFDVTLSDGLEIPVALGRPPRFTSGPAATVTVGQPAEVSLSADGVSIPSLGTADPLPGGLTLADRGDGTATLSGTPAVGGGGIHILTLEARNPKGTASQSFALTVRQAPIITSVATVTFHAGATSAFNIVSSAYPYATVSIAGRLPAGVTFKDGGGGVAVLSSSAVASLAVGTYPLTITATNELGTRTQVLTLVVDEPPIITSAPAVTMTAGRASVFSITTTGTPTPVTSVSGVLPAGIGFVANATGGGVVSGTPGARAGGRYPIMVTASSSAGIATQSAEIVVRQPPTIIAPPTMTFHIGQRSSVVIETAAFPTARLALVGGLPTGVTFVDGGDGTARLAGTPVAGSARTYTLGIGAINVAGAAAVQIVLIVDQIPRFSSAAAVTVAVGKRATFTFVSVGVPTPVVTVAGDLPAGLAVAAGAGGTAVLSGTPAVGTAGTFRLTAAATSSAGTATQVFVLTVAQEPSITSVNAVTFRIGVPNTFTVTASGVPSPIFAVTGLLPVGVIFSDNGNGTATIKGSPGARSSGSYRLLITATNPAGSVTQVVTFTVR